jgi:hypothetical protein
MIRVTVNRSIIERNAETGGTAPPFTVIHEERGLVGIASHITLLGHVELNYNSMAPVGERVWIEADAVNIIS